jgi:hypothetical protein
MKANDECGMMNAEFYRTRGQEGLASFVHIQPVNSSFIILNSSFRGPAFQTALDPPSVHVRGGLRPTA